MSQKVVAIAAGEAHTLARTADGAIYTWGRGTFGRLGTGGEADELAPVRIPDVGAGKFVEVAAGAYHSLALDEKGSLWSWGYNIYGQLGYGEENSPYPGLVERFQELVTPDEADSGGGGRSRGTPLQLTSVKAGGMMSFAIDSLGGLWMWGNCPQQTDGGEFRLVSSSAPLPVWDFHGHTVVKVACGKEHVVAAVSAGETYTGGDLICYAWGNNSNGQLGLGDRESRSRPVVIPTFGRESSWEVYDIACGACHSAVLTTQKSFDQLESQCWTFGLGDNGQLGHGTTASLSAPQPVIGLPRDTFLISLDCGLFHTAVASADGEVWCWGMEKGLGLCPDASFNGEDAGDALLPRRVQSPEGNGYKFSGVVQVGCGAAHTVLVAGDGHKVWTWGRGRSGVLGHGRTTDSYIPCAVKWDTSRDTEVTLRRQQKSRAAPGETGNASREAKSRAALSETANALREAEQKLSEATEELRSLKMRMTLMERYANILHISIFRKPLDERALPQSLQDSPVFDIKREFESFLEAAETDELERLEMFYRSMLSGVKDKLMKRRVKEMVRECLAASSSSSSSSPRASIGGGGRQSFRGQ